MIDWLRRLRRPPDPIPADLWRDTRAAVPWVAALDPDRDARLALLAAEVATQRLESPELDAQIQRLIHGEPSTSSPGS